MRRKLCKVLLCFYCQPRTSVSLEKISPWCITNITACLQEIMCIISHFLVGLELYLISFAKKLLF